LTVCIASIFVWKYGENDLGRAVITMSDRQITAADIEFEPNTAKVCTLAPNVLLLIAGDYPTHSEAIRRTQRQLVGSGINDPTAIADIYAAHVKAVKAEQAARLYLSPVWLDKESFLAKQSDLAPDLLHKLTDQLQGYRGEDTEAIITGVSGNDAFVYVVDQNTNVINYSDVGFAAIGIGAWHAKSQMMRAAFTRRWFYTATVGLTYAAKKAAEIAPGVGEETDAYLITRAGCEELFSPFFEKTKEMYEDYEKKRDALVADTFSRLNDWLRNYTPPSKGADIKGQPQEKKTDDQEPKTSREPEASPDSKIDGKGAAGTAEDKPSA
jgi:hypothetical protein